MLEPGATPAITPDPDRLGIYMRKNNPRPWRIANAAGEVYSAVRVELRCASETLMAGGSGFLIARGALRFEGDVAIIE